MALTVAQAEERMQKFAKAVGDGDRATVESMLAEGIDPNTRIPKYHLQYTPLFIAVNNNDLELTKVLLQAGANPMIEDGNGDPVMVHASDHETVKVARYLIAQGYSIDAKNKSGITALMRDAPYAEERDIQAKIDLGADLNLTDSNGDTALMIAAASRNHAAMKSLVKAGAHLDVLNLKGKSALMLALDSRYANSDHLPETVRVLVDGGANLDLRDKDGKTALLIALDEWSVDTNIVEALLKGKPRLDIRDPETGETPLFKAVMRGDFKIPVATMLERGADPKTISEYGIDLFMLAAGNGDLALMRDLLERGLSSTRKDQSGATAVHRAAGNTRRDGNAVEVLKFLRKLGVPMTLADSHGHTPLHRAVRSGLAPVVAYLLPDYKELMFRDHHGRTLLHHAASPHTPGSVAVIDLLLPHIDLEAIDNDGRTALWVAMNANHQDLILRLLRAKADVNATDGSGRTLLEEMLERDLLEHVRLLIEHGAIPSKIKDPDRLLRLAVRHFHDHPGSAEDYVFRIKFLASLAKEIDSPDAEGRTPLMWVASSNHEQALAELLKRQPNLDRQCADGRTALMWAASTRAQDSIKLLRAAGADDSLRDHQGRGLEEWASWATSSVAHQANRSPLHERITRSRATALEAYLERKTWNDTHRISGYSPLHLAASLNDLKAVETLLLRGAPINLRLEDLTTPLMTAATNGRTKIAQRFIDSSANLSFRNSEGHRALDLAVSYEHWDTARLLVRTGEALSENEADLLHTLVVSGNGGLLKEALEAGAAILPPEKREAEDPFSNNNRSVSATAPLVAAAHAEDPTMLKILNEHPIASGSTETALVNVALHHAADAGRLQNVKYLADTLQADTNSLLDNQMGGVMRVDQPPKAGSQPVKGYSPLSRALESGHHDIVRYLVERGVTITGRTNGGYPPVTYAVVHRQHLVLQLFLKHQASPELVDLDTMTALHHAAANDDEVAVRLLLKHGANSKAKTNDGDTPLDLARKSDSRKTINLLESALTND